MQIHEAGALHADVNQHPDGLAQPVDLNELPAGVWPRGVRRNSTGVLELAGADVRDLAAEFGTPAYIIDEADFRGRCRDFADAFADADVHYAAKAFCATGVLRWVADEGLGLDVCTGGELATALAAGFDPARIAMHGNNKSIAELERAVDVGVGRIVVDSFVEIARLAAIAERKGRTQPVLVRATVGVEAHTHEFIATAHEDQKFGFSLASGDALEAINRIRGLSSLQLLGVHSHIGSQIFDTAGFEVAARRAVGLLRQARDEFGVTLGVLDLGGGFGIAYTPLDDPVDIGDIARSLTSIVARECADADYPPPRLAVEPGRSIAGPGTVTLYEVGTVKDVDGIRTYVSVDGGMSDNIRTALYDAVYSCALVSRASDAPAMRARVVGKHCESGDIVVRDVWLPDDVAPGDLLAVPATGAYCRSMSSNYNHVPRPPVVAVRDGVGRVLVRRETEDDLLRLDVGE
jgi:diaminopimelate decarboxylase